MIRYSEDLVEEVRNSNNIVDIISQYVILKKRGRNYIGLCPFHREKTPSFSVSPDKQIFHCFGCGVGGSVFNFVSKIENISFRESIERLADRAGIMLPKVGTEEELKKQKLKEKIYEINEKAAEFYHNNLYTSNAKLGQEYVKKRKLNNKTLKDFKIGFAGLNDSIYDYLKKLGYKYEEILESKLVRKGDNNR